MDENRIVSNLVVLMAIKTLTIFVNPANGVLNSRDKKHVMDTFKILVDNGEPYNPTEIKSWFILKAKFRPKLSEEIATIAKGLQEGRSFRSNSKMPTYLDDVIDSWRDDAKDPKLNSEELKY